MRVSYMIATRNRREELLKTLAACRAQNYPNKEVHVVDDCSSDGTFEAVRAEFPEVVLTRNDPNIGSVASRNQIFRRVTGEVLIGFDDDSRFIDIDATTQVVNRFNKEPDLGLIEFQDVGPEYPDRIPPDSQTRRHGERHISSFAASRYALRRSVLNKTGLFSTFFWHAYEEPDLALRIWDAGFRCLAWYDVLVWHEWSGLNRNEANIHRLHARNEQLSNLMRTPWLLVFPLGVYRMLSQLRYSIRRGWWLAEPLVWWEVLKLVPTAIKSRRPVRTETLRRCLLLNRRTVADPAEAWALGTGRF